MSEDVTQGRWPDRYRTAVCAACGTRARLGAGGKTLHYHRGMDYRAQLDGPRHVPIPAASPTVT